MLNSFQHPACRKHGGRGEALSCSFGAVFNHGKRAQIMTPDQQAAASRQSYQVEFAKSALANLTLVSGGAVVALLTFVGNTDKGHEPIALWWAFFWFTISLASAIAAHFPAFLSQFEFMKAEDSPRGHFWFWIGLSVGGVSLGTFIAGAFVALDAIT